MAKKFSLGVGEAMNRAFEETARFVDRARRKNELETLKSEQEQNMNEVFDNIVGKIINHKIKAPKGVTLMGTQDGINVKMDDGSNRFVMLFVVLVFTPYSYAPETYDFNSCMSDDELEELYGKLEKRMMILKNIGR